MGLSQLDCMLETKFAEHPFFTASIPWELDVLYWTARGMV